MSKTTAFFDVDTQRDFLSPAGALYVPGARMVSGSIRRLVAHAAAKGIRLFSTVDAHAVDDPEFDDFPPHCVVGSWGQEKIDGTLLADRVAVRSAPKLSRLAIEIVLRRQQVILESATISVSTNPNVVPVLRASGCTRFVVFGVATDYCVRAAALGLLENGFRVDLVTDAVKGITPAGADAALAEMRQAGARLRTTSQIVT